MDIWIKEDGVIKSAPSGIEGVDITIMSSWFFQRITHQINSSVARSSYPGFLMNAHSRSTTRSTNDEN
jgi:hypothetical protein